MMYGINKLSRNGNIFLLVFCFVVSGCTFLPNDGPSSSSIAFGTKTLEVAAISKKNKETYYLARFSSKAKIPFISQRNNFYAKTSEEWNLLSLLPPAEMGINIGDEIRLIVFESQQDGLFLAKNVLANSGKFTTLPPQFVDISGSIYIPYVGQISVAGKTIRQAQLEITQLLKEKAIEPQVLITFADRRGAEVSVLGEVQDSQRYQLGFQGEHVLDVIAAAGGPANSDGRNTFVTLHRNNTKAIIHFDRLVEDPDSNVIAQPGDVVYLANEPALYTVHGSTSSTGIFSFEQRRTISLVEALGTAGGLNNFAANPTKIYVFRRENVSYLERIGFNVANSIHENIVPVIYQLDLSSVDGMMIAKNFSIENQDVIYVPNSNSVELNKFLSILDPSAITSINTRDAINYSNN